MNPRTKHPPAPGLPPPRSQRYIALSRACSIAFRIANGNGRVRVGDTDWNARGADAVVGAKVRVIGADGAVLLVEGV